MDTRVKNIRVLQDLITIAAIVAFISLMVISSSFGQWPSFSGGYSYPGSIYSGYSRYGYSVSPYGQYSGYPGYGPWSSASYTYEAPPPATGFYQINPFNPKYGLVPPGYGPLWASTHYPVSSPTFQFITQALLKSEYYPGDRVAMEKSIAFSLLNRLMPGSIIHYPPFSYVRPYSWPIILPQSYTPPPPDYDETDVTLYKKDNGDNVRLETGETLSIIILGTGDSKVGYQWRVNNDELDTEVMDKKSIHYFGNDEEQWIFKAMGPGTTTIKLEYKELIIDTEIKDVFEITVTVE